MIWTDCDREGENIGYEIAQYCQKFKNIIVKRARFSAVISEYVEISNLVKYTEPVGPQVTWTSMQLKQSKQDRKSICELELPLRDYKRRSCAINSL